MERAILCLDEGSFRCRADAPYIFAHISSSIKGGEVFALLGRNGVGKSTLLSMIARNTEADISVITLVGERGREVRDFIERDLGEEGLKRSVVVVGTRPYQGSYDGNGDCGVLPRSGAQGRAYDGLCDALCDGAA